MLNIVFSCMKVGHQKHLKLGGICTLEAGKIAPHPPLSPLRVNEGAHSYVTFGLCIYVKWSASLNFPYSANGSQGDWCCEKRNPFKKTRVKILFKSPVLNTLTHFRGNRPPIYCKTLNSFSWRRLGRNYLNLLHCLKWHCHAILVLF